MSPETTNSTSGYWDNIDHHVGAALRDAFWLSHPLVRARINRRITGHENRWPTDFLKRFLGSHTLPRCASIGCGAGALERDLLSKGIAQHVVGVDIGEEPLAYARSERDRVGIDPSVLEYVRADATGYLAHQSNLDAIFFHGSLHHVDEIDATLRLASEALKSSGILYADEYVGPSMHQWNLRRLLLPNLFHSLLSRHVRRVRLVRAPRNPEDPTEMIRSHAIMPGIRRHFHVEAIRDYGGNLLALIYPNLRRPSPGRPRPTTSDLDRAVDFLANAEDWLLSHGARSHHSIVIARTKSHSG